MVVAELGHPEGKLKTLEDRPQGFNWKTFLLERKEFSIDDPVALISVAFFKEGIEVATEKEKKHGMKFPYEFDVVYSATHIGLTLTGVDRPSIDSLIKDGVESVGYPRDERLEVILRELSQFAIEQTENQPHAHSSMKTS